MIERTWPRQIPLIFFLFFAVGNPVSLADNFTSLLRHHFSSDLPSDSLFIIIKLDFIWTRSLWPVCENFDRPDMAEISITSYFIYFFSLVSLCVDWRSWWGWTTSTEGKESDKTNGTWRPARLRDGHKGIMPVHVTPWLVFFIFKVTVGEKFLSRCNSWLTNHLVHSPRERYPPVDDGDVRRKPIDKPGCIFLVLCMCTFDNWIEISQSLQLVSAVDLLERDKQPDQTSHSKIGRDGENGN